MDESLTQPRRVSEEGLRVVKLCRRGRKAFGLIAQEPDGTLKGSTG
jgi:hypothetical protein